MSNIAKAFADGKAFIPFITCGDPDLKTTAAAIRAKDCVMKTVTNVREGAEDIYADANAINERRAAEAAPEVIENTSADAE